MYYSSSFQHSVTGFGGRLLRLGGDLVGGTVGERAQQVGWDAEWMRAGVRGSTRDKALAWAVEEMKPFFHQCHRCGQWVCEQVCWNGQRGLCTTCAQRLDLQIAGMRAQPEPATFVYRGELAAVNRALDDAGFRAAALPPAVSVPHDAAWADRIAGLFG
jgi:hypothetical protein